jgi:hypothetical protein
LESVPESLKPPKGWTPTMAPVILRFRYTLPASNSHRSLSRWWRSLE